MNQKPIPNSNYITSSEFCFLYDFHCQETLLARGLQYILLLIKKFRLPLLVERIVPHPTYLVDISIEVQNGRQLFVRKKT